MNIRKLLFQNVIWKGLFYLSGFVLTIFIARHFMASFTGQLYYLISWFALITLLLSASLESGMLYYASKNHVQRAPLVNFSLLCVLAAAVLITAGYGLISVLMPGSVSTELYVFALIFITGNLLITFMGSLFYAGKNFIVPNAAGIAINIILIFVLFFLPGETYLYVYFGSFLVQGIIVALFLLTQNGIKNNLSLPSVQSLRSVFHYSSLAFVANIISFFLYRVDYWFVNKYCSAQHLGDYIQVSKLAQLFFVLPAMFATVLFPLTAGGHRQKVNETVTVLSRLLFLGYGLICLVLALTGKWLFPWVFGESFSGMYIPFLFLVPGILAFSSLYALTAYYAGKNRVMVNVKGCFLAFIFVLAGDIFLIPVYGINAAAAVSSAGYIIYFIYVLVVFTKEYNIPVSRFFYSGSSNFRNLNNKK